MRNFVYITSPNSRLKFSVLCSIHLGAAVMADYSFGGSDEENTELKKLNADVVRTKIKALFPRISSRSCR